MNVLLCHCDISRKLIVVSVSVTIGFFEIKGKMYFFGQYLNLT
jgi:hypothetical protein